jgi:outer membrane protein insertion porin family
LRCAGTKLSQSCVVVFLLASAFAQVPQIGGQSAAALHTFAGQKVVAVNLAGWPGLAAAPLLAQLPQKAGQPFSPLATARSLALLRRLLAARHLRGIELDIRPDPAGIRLLFLLEPAQYFGVFEFPGLVRFAYTGLLEATGYRTQQPYTAHAVHAGAQGLTAFLHQEGYFLATVRTQLQSLPSEGLVNVIFHTNLGPRARYGIINFPGVAPAQAARLRASLASWLARLRRIAILPGHAYSYRSIQSDVTYLQAELNHQGRRGASVAFAGALYHRATNRADLTFAVAPGPRVRLNVTGAFLWPWTRHSLIPIYSESRISPDVIQEGQTNLADYMAAHGYFHAAVTSTVSAVSASGVQTTHTSTESIAAAAPPALPSTPPPAVPPASVAITYAIVKGPRHDVEGIHFQGNRHIPSARLLPQVRIKAEHLFSHGSFSQFLLRQSVANLTDLYQADGFSSVVITPVIATPNGNLDVTFHIAEGPQDRVESLRLLGATVPLATLIPGGLALGPGTPFAQRLVNRDRAHILAWYLSHGYLNAAFRATAQRLPAHPHRITVVYNIVQGPQVRTARVLTVGRLHTRQRYINRQIRQLQPGHLLTENAMFGAESRLYAPGIFDWAEITPRRPITTQTSSAVVVKVHEAPRSSITYGIGFDLTNRGGSIPSGTVAVPGLPIVGLPSSFKTSQATFWGPSGTFEYTRINLLGKAESFTAAAYAGRLDQRGSLDYLDPGLLWSRFSSTLDLSAEHNSENPIFTSRSFEVGYQVERPLTADRTANLFLRYSFSQTGLTRLLIPALVPLPDQHIHLSTFSATFLRDTRDNPLNAHKGILESYELDFSPSAFGSSANFARFLSQTAYYHRIFGNIVWANSFRYGLDHAFGSSFVPLSEAFFSGGGSTLRGFPLDGAGPQRTIPACGNPSVPSTCSLINVPVGGNQLLIVNTELRIPTPFLWKPLGFAVFYDGGNVFSHIGFSHFFSNYTNSVGAGLRYSTPLGPIRIDVGHNLSPVPGISATQLFITLGQAF